MNNLFNIKKLDKKLLYFIVIILFFVALIIIYIHNVLSVENIRNNYTSLSLEENLKIYAYVNGVEVETFPTDPNYDTGIACFDKDENQIYNIKGTFRYTAENGWELDILGLNRGLSTCKVDFDKNLVITYEVLQNRYDCANVEDANRPSDPLIIYTGDCKLFQDTENTDGTHTWRMKLLTSGSLTVNGVVYIDAFLVGGGGGGNTGVYTSNGGGGGYTKTIENIRLDNTVESYPITIGSGGDAKSSPTIAQNTIAFGESISGGSYDGTGGSAGGTKNSKIGKSYGNGGQGTTTCEFGEGTLEGCNKGDEYAYAAGGGYGYNSASSGGVTGGGQGGNGKAIPGKDGANNTGSGGGGGGVYDCENSAGGLSYCSSAAGKGGSGVVVIRNYRT